MGVVGGLWFEVLLLVYFSFDYGMFLFDLSFLHGGLVIFNRPLPCQGFGSSTAKALVALYGCVEMIGWVNECIDD